MRRRSLVFVLLFVAVGLLANVSAGPSVPEPGIVLSAAPDVPDSLYAVGNAGDPAIIVFPTGSAPPGGLIVAKAKGDLTDGQAFVINDHSAALRAGVRFYVRKTAGYVAPGGGVPIIVPAPQNTNAAQVANAIAAAINGVGPELHVNAAGQADGTVDLSYDYASDVDSTGNDVTIETDVASPYPGAISWTAGGPHNDLQHIQWAVNNVASGGSVILKAHTPDTGVLTPFDFGENGNIVIARNVSMLGESLAHEPLLSPDGPGGWTLAGTTIKGGTQMQVGIPGMAQVTVSIRDIIFDGFKAGAIRVSATKGVSDVTRCLFRNGRKGRVFRGSNPAFPLQGPIGLFPVIAAAPLLTAQGVATDEGVLGLAGALTVLNNYFGPPTSDPAGPYNNLLHFSDCNLQLEIHGNVIEDAHLAGLAVWGNQGRTVITRNVVTKTLTFASGGADWPGAGIAFGLKTSTYDSPHTHDGSAVIANNLVTVTAPTSHGIVVTGGTDVAVLDNHIRMTGSTGSALSCLGTCSGSAWGGNTVEGTAAAGILLSKAPPFWALAPADPNVSNNMFADIDMLQFTPTGYYVVCDDDRTRDNVGTGILVPPDSCDSFLRDDGIDNAFSSLAAGSATASPATLWPPNHQLVPVAIVSATGTCGIAPCRIAGVTSNEPEGPDRDWEVTGPLSLLLRADRLGTGTGRIYTITIACEGADGDSVSKTVTVKVPHDIRR